MSTTLQNRVVAGTVKQFSPADRSGVLLVENQEVKFSGQVFSGGLVKKWPEDGDQVRVVLAGNGEVLLVRRP